MGSLLQRAAVFYFRQALPQLNAIHTTSPRVYGDSSHHRSSNAPAEVTVPSVYFKADPYLPCSGLPGLFGSIHLEQVAQLHARLVQLRLAVSNRASCDLGDFIMLVTLNVMQDKYCPVARGKVVYRPLQLHPVN